MTFLSQESKSVLSFLEQKKNHTKKIKNNFRFADPLVSRQETHTYLKELSQGSCCVFSLITKDRPGFLFFSSWNSKTPLINRKAKWHTDTLPSPQNPCKTFPSLIICIHMINIYLHFLGFQPCSRVFIQDLERIQ